ncbi:MAG: hypothetical protein R3F48_16900 [Candidatus Zixiibacteriota bacterium]
MKAFLIASPDGVTYSPACESTIADVEYMHVLGIGFGEDYKSALKTFLKDNPDMKNQGYEFFCVYTLEKESPAHVHLRDM